MSAARRLRFAVTSSVEEPDEPTAPPQSKTMTDKLYRKKQLDARKYVVYTNRKRRVTKANSRAVDIDMTDMYINNEKVGQVGFYDNRIVDLKVLPQHQGKGYARLLINQILATKNPPLIIEARPLNERNNISLDDLVKFYSSCGFVPMPSSEQTRPGSVYMFKGA